MSQFLRINLYEIQAILFWILGEIILHFGKLGFIGWIAIGYGWLTFFTTIVIAARHKEELKEFFSKK